jgi:hypothetical protein
LTRYGSSLIEERDRRALANPLGKVKGVPIGKPDAAMRPGFADLFRVARSMNSVGRLIQIDPDQADRVVGTGAIVSSLSVRTPLNWNFGS